MPEAVYVSSYETVFLIKPDVDDATVNAAVERVKGAITQNSGVITAQENWGKRTMAYDIKRYRTAHYVLLRFAGPGPLVAEVERYYKMMEQVIKWMTIVLEEDLKPENIVGIQDAPITSVPVGGPEGEFRYADEGRRPRFASSDMDEEDEDEPGDRGDDRGDDADVDGDDADDEDKNK